MRNLILLCCMIFTTLYLSGQQSSITANGVVLDGDTGTPIPGVNVIETSTSNGVVTDFDGKFSISVSKGTVLKFSYIGFSSKEVTITNSDPITVALELEAEGLDEVVVVGYGSMRKRDLTGAIVSLKPSSDDAAIATSFDDLIQGKAAGVMVVGGGSSPGSAGSITIRGANSLQGDSQPLYVIDNVPQSSTGQTMRSGSGDFQPVQDPLAGINPNDIADIQILKDASATAIYGSRGANGVILITTKKGTVGKPKIRVGANFSVSEADGLYDLMDLREYANFWNTKYPSDQRFVVDDQVRYLYTSEDNMGQTLTKEILLHHRDWQREATRPGLSQEFNLNANGGGQSLRYNFSTSYKNVEGIVEGTGLRHGDFRLNLNGDLTDKLSFGVQLSGFLRENNMMSGGNTVGRASGAIIPTALNAQPFLRPTDDVSFTDSPEDRATVLSWVSDYDDITHEYRFTAAMDVNYQITDNLKYTFRTGGNLNNRERDTWYGLEIFKGYNNNGFLNQNRLERSNYNVENLLFYTKSFGIVDINATAGVTYDVYKWLNTSIVATDFPFYNLRTSGLHTANSVVVENPVQSDYQLLSYLSRINASFFDGKYVITGTMRADGTSKFSEGNKWGYFPSFAVAWNVGQENFLENTQWLSQFKLRAGYGNTGSQNISPYSSIFLYGSGGGYADPTGAMVQGLGVSGVNNPDLKWETTQSINGGLDFGFFQDRISGAVDFYKKSTKDLLLNITLPGSTSFNSLAVNRGEIENEGVEAFLNMEVLRNKDFSWSVGGNIGFNQTTIHKLGLPEGEFGALGEVSAFYGNFAGDHFGNPNVFIEGEAPGLFFGFQTDGIIQEGDVYEAGNPFGNSIDPGNIKVVDVNQDGIVDINDKTIIGDPNPDFTYGMHTNFSYKQFRFKTTFVGVKGGDIFNANQRYNELASFQNGDRNMNPAAIANAWTPENQSNVYPSILSNVANGHIYDRFIEDGSYLRCSDITLGYTFKEEVAQKLGLSGLDLFASAKNAFTITDYSGYDPTSRSFGFDPLRRGFDLWSFPSQRQIIVGVNLTF